MTADLHDAIHRWHRSDTDAELHQWLGLTWAQYAAWVERGTLPDGYELPARARRDLQADVATVTVTRSDGSVEVYSGKITYGGR